MDDAEATQNFYKVKGSTRSPNTGFTSCIELNMAEVEELLRLIHRSRHKEVLTLNSKTKQKKGEISCPNATGTPEAQL